MTSGHETFVGDGLGGEMGFGGGFGPAEEEEVDVSIKAIREDRPRFEEDREKISLPVNCQSF